jgi:hypothetical protein
VTDVLAWDVVYDSIVARFAELASPATFAFGWREPEVLEETPRIVFVPGDDTTNDIGEVTPPRNVGEVARDLLQIGELFTIYIAARDDTDRENERLQYRVSRFLLDDFLAALYLAATGTHRIVSLRWVRPKAALRTGGSIRVVVALEAPVPDEAAGVEVANAVGVTTTELLDNEEEDATGPLPAEALAAADANVALAGEQTVDDVALVAGDRVLLVNQTNPVENGLWIVAAGAWSRTDDELVHGTHVHVEDGGTELGGAGYRVFTPDPFVVGTDPFAFERLWPPVP